MFWSLPTTVPCMVRPSASCTSTVVAPSVTWAAVMMCPALSKMKPEPRPDWVDSCTTAGMRALAAAAVGSRSSSSLGAWVACVPELLEPDEEPFVVVVARWVVTLVFCTFAAVVEGEADDVSSSRARPTAKPPPSSPRATRMAAMPLVARRLPGVSPVPLPLPGAAVPAPPAPGGGRGGRGGVGGGPCGASRGGAAGSCVVTAPGDHQPSPGRPGSSATGGTGPGSVCQSLIDGDRTQPGLKGD